MDFLFFSFPSLLSSLTFLFGFTHISLDGQTGKSKDHETHDRDMRTKNRECQRRPGGGHTTTTINRSFSRPSPPHLHVVAEPVNKMDFWAFPTPGLL